MEQVSAERRSYEERKAARIERLRSRAAAKAEEGNTLLTKDDALRACMNGTPILIGHHSERRHRRDLDRIRANTRKGFEALEEAKRLERAAALAESSKVISSEDPEAITKLEAKRAKLVKLHADIKAINGAIGRAKEPEKIKERLRAAVAAGKVDLPESHIELLAKPDACGRVGIPSYKLTNNASEIRRVEQRIEELKRRTARKVPDPVKIGEVEIREEDDRVRMFFPGKPRAEVISELKAQGFKWAPSCGAWIRSANSLSWDRAKRIAESAAS